MAENIIRSSVSEVPGKQKERTVAFTRKGLSVINGEINARKRNTNNVSILHNDNLFSDFQIKYILLVKTFLALC